MLLLLLFCFAYSLAFGEYILEFIFVFIYLNILEELYGGQFFSQMQI